MSTIHSVCVVWFPFSFHWLRSRYFIRVRRGTFQTHFDISVTFFYGATPAAGIFRPLFFFLEFLGIQSIFLRCGYRFLHVDVSVGNRRAEVLPNTYIFGRQDRLAHATDHVRPREKKKKNKSDLKRRQSLLFVGGCVCVWL